MTVRVLNTPSELHWLAASGLLDVHWHSFMHHLLGDHTLSVRARLELDFSVLGGAETHNRDYDSDEGASNGSARRSVAEPFFPRVLPPSPPRRPTADEDSSDSNE